MKLQLALLEAEWFSDEARKELATHFAVTEFGEQCSIQAVLSKFDIVVLRLSVRITESDIPSDPKCRLVGVPATGLDHVAVRALEAHGVEVIGLHQCSKSIDGISATAEHAVGLLISLVRRIPMAAWVVANRREWNRNNFRGQQLAGRTVGVIGLGRIGMKFARIAQAMEMKVVGFDRTRREIEGVVQMDSIEDLLAISDVISLHASLDESSIQMIGGRELEFCKEGSILVNTARGQLLDTEALIQHLKTGHLAGAALDVVEGEPNAIPDFVYEYAAMNDNLILTPHIGGNTAESVRLADMVLVDEIIKRCGQ